MGKRRGVRIQRWQKRVPWPLLLIFIAFAVATILTALKSYQREKREFIREHAESLEIASSLKAAQIQDWRANLRENGRSIESDSIIVNQLLAYLRRPSDALRSSLGSWLDDLCRHFHFRGFILTDPSGSVRLANRDSIFSAKHYDLSFLQKALLERAVLLTEMHASGHFPQPHLDLILPLRGEASAPIEGFLIGFVDPQDKLFPILGTWPILANSAETLLVRRDGDDVLFLSELRFHPRSTMKFRLPVSSTNLPAALAIQGKRGVIHGRDYRGVPVWSVVRPISESSWFLVTKIDEAELLAPLHANARNTLMAVLLILLATGAMLMMVGRRQITHARVRELEAENRRQALERHFEYLSRYANDMILLCGEKGDILEANERAELIYGHNRKNLRQMNLRDLVPSGDRERFAERIREAVSPLGLIFETQQEKRDGTVFPAEVSARMIDSEGKKFLQCIIRDISERKKAEEALQMLSARNEALLAAVPNILMEVDNGKVYRWANQVGLAFFGDDVVGRPADFYFVGEQKTYETVQPLFNGRKEIVYVESWQRRHDGEKRLLAWWCRVLTDNAGNPTGALSSALDITESRRAEQELRESEERFRGLYENSTMGLYRTTPAGRILLANPALVNMLGYSSFQELSRRNLEQEGYEPNYQRVEFQRLIESKGELKGFESCWIKADGTTIFVSESAKAVRDSEGKISYYEGTVEDISARKKAEKEILELNAELEDRVNQRTNQLTAANKELEAFSYSVSHDLRAPLRAITGFSQILAEERSGSLGAEGRRLLGVITDNTHRMGQLIDDLLAFSRLGRQALAPAKVDFTSLARSLFAELKIQEKGRKIEFTAGKVPASNGDTAMLRQLLHNLLSNAIKFTRTRKPARIEFGGRAEKNENVYYVKDNGVGFDMQYAGKLFVVFQRLHGSAEFEGTGVGLAIVQRIAARHGGRVWAEGEVGKGATFYFALPNQGGTHD